MKHLLPLALAAAAALALPAKADLSDILNAGTVSIGVPENFPPFGSLGASGQPEGYDVDVANMVADDLGVELDLVPLTSSQRIPFLETNRVDIVISSMGANPQRARSIWFTSAYAPFYSGAYAAPDVQLASMEDLGGLSVGVTSGTLEDMEITENAPDDTQITRFGDNSATLSAFTSGQVDVLVTGNTVAARLMENNQDLAMESKFIIQNSPAFMGVQQGNLDLVRWLNVFIMSKKLGGELDDLSQEWFGEDLPDLPTL